MRNKPNFPRFYAKNNDYDKKQTQFKPNSNPIICTLNPTWLRVKLVFKLIVAGWEAMGYYLAYNNSFWSPEKKKAKVER